MTRILVTGGAGYIGSHTCKLLAREGFEVAVVDNLSRGHRDFVQWGPLIEADIRVARIFNTYGPRMNPADGRVVSNLIVQALRGEDMTIYGSGDQTRSFCYCDDMIEGFLRLMDAADEVTGPVNLGNPDELSVDGLANLVVEMTGTRSRIVKRPLPSDDPVRRCPDISRARELLDWTARVPLREGLRQTIDHFQEKLAIQAL